MATEPPVLQAGSQELPTRRVEHGRAGPGQDWLRINLESSAGQPCPGEELAILPRSDPEPDDFPTGVGDQDKPAFIFRLEARRCLDMPAATIEDLKEVGPLILRRPDTPEVRSLGGESASAVGVPGPAL